MNVQVRSNRSAVSIALAGAAVAFLGGCASDSSRLGDPFSNPFSTASRDVDRAPTATIPEDMPARSGGVRSGPIQSTPLPAPGTPAAGPAQQHYGSAPQSQPAYAPPQRIAQGGGVSGNWSAQGGAQITVGYGETASMLAARYGVPADALLRVNGFSSAGQVKQGTRLVIPVYSANAAAPERAAAATPMHGKPATPAKVGAAPTKFVMVKGPGGKIIKMESAPAGKAAVTGKGKPLASASPEAVKTAAVKTPLAAGGPAPKAGKGDATKVAKVEASPAPKVQQAIVRGNVDPAPTASLPAKADAAPAADANPEFRWPARGRIIQGFKSGGNDGINISVPEGTAVKAAENGVVAYAGSELKGYGNLVLIRHPNGFVSAYGNNGEIEVKRGDTVKRGQTIAKSGQTGNVATPQLHFELRKGATPVDPTQYLAGL
jgi:murein DD-endopeptidase MepM/ murein hydrolase activator NlpD